MADKTFKRCEEEAFELAETFEKRHLTNKEIAEIFHTVVESRMPTDNGFHPQGVEGKSRAYANYWESGVSGTETTDP